MITVTATKKESSDKDQKNEDIIKGGLISMEKIIKDAESLKIYGEGDAVSAKVERVTKNRVYVNIDNRIQGIIGGKELFFDPQFVKGLKAGDEITAYVILSEDDDGSMLLSLRKAGKENVWADLQKKFDDKETISVVVTDANKGGLMIELGGIKGFLPVSQLATENYPRVDGGNKDDILARLKELIRQTIEVKILSLDKPSNKLIFSEREAIGNRDIPAEIKVGDVVDGKVTGMVDFGFFVDVNGIEGLVHISEISWGKVDNIESFVKVDDELKLKIIDIENSRLSLSLKQLEEDPWNKLVKGLKKGDKIDGEVSRITPFGAFVKIDLGDGKGIEALVHISEISDKHLTDPKEVLSIGEKKKFKILSIEPRQHRLSLSLKDVDKKDEKKDDKDNKKEDKKEKNGGLMGLGASIAKKLSSVGIKKVDDLKGKKKEDLTEIEGIGEKTAEKILEEIND